MSQAADERTGEAASERGRARSAGAGTAERDAVERHFARSILAMLTATPELSYGNGDRGHQVARPQLPPLSGAGVAAPIRPDEPQ